MNKPYDSRKPLVSVHMPKCGGNSFTSILRQWFGNDLRLHYFSERNNQPPPRYDLGPGSCVHGHFNAARGIGLDHYYPHLNQRITILRDPLEVAISGYFFKSKRAKAGQYYKDGEKREAPELSLEQHLTEKPSFFFKFLPFDRDEEDYRAILDKYFLYIGILEEFERTVNDLSQLLEKPNIPPKHENTAPRTHDIPEWAAARFRQLNKRAFEIYDYARERFERRAR